MPLGWTVAEAVLRSLRPAVWGVTSVCPSAGGVLLLLVCFTGVSLLHNITSAAAADTANQR